MASFAGIDLGLAVTMQPANNPPEAQVNTYPGVNGLEVLNLGTRGGITVAQGRLAGSTRANLAAVEQSIRGLANGQVATLVDSLGTAWPAVRLEEFHPVGRVQLDPDLLYTRRYEARFTHLI